MTAGMQREGKCYNIMDMDVTDAFSRRKMPGKMLFRSVRELGVEREPFHTYSLTARFHRSKLDSRLHNRNLGPILEWEGGELENGEEEDGGRKGGGRPHLSLSPL